MKTISEFNDNNRIVCAECGKFLSICDNCEDYFDAEEWIDCKKEEHYCCKEWCRTWKE